MASKQPIRTVTVSRDPKTNEPVIQVQEQAEPEQAKPTVAPRAKQLEKFIQLAQAGVSVGQALKDSGVLQDPDTSHVYEPSQEIQVEEIFYKRCSSRDPKLVTEEEYNNYSPEEKQQHSDNGDLRTVELFRVVDWLYYVKGLPLKAIASSLRVRLDIIMKVKAELSNEFSKVIRLQNADGYIADLMRTKELLKADLMYRKSQLPPGHSQQVTLNRLLWELENNLIDRLQEIGIIDKHLGRMQVHEEWHVSIGSAGQPVNNKMKEIPTKLSDEDAYFDAELVTESNKTAPSTPDSPTAPDIFDATAEDEREPGAVPSFSATIQVDTE